MLAGNTPTATRVPVLGTILTAWRTVSASRRYFLWSACVPLVAYLVIHAALDVAYLLPYASPSIRTLSWRVLAPLPVAYYALLCHRHILLRAEGVPPRTAGASIVGFAGLWVAGSIWYQYRGWLVPEVAPDTGPLVAVVFASSLIAASAGFVYVTARLSLVLPILAVEFRLRIKEAWQLSHNNGWRLAFISFLAVLPVGAVVLGLQSVAPQLDNPDLRSTPWWFATGAVLGALARFASVALVATAVSLAFRQLRPHAA